MTRLDEPRRSLTDVSVEPEPRAPRDKRETVPLYRGKAVHDLLDAFTEPPEDA